MWVGIIHSKYRSTLSSGENLTVEEIARAIEKAGHTVVFWTLDTDSFVNKPLLKFVIGFRNIFFDTKRKQFKKFLNTVDMLQVHNSFPVLTSRNIKDILKSKKLVVRVVHNYRASCLKGNHFRKGKNCFSCKKRGNLLLGVVRRCYQDSLLKSLLVLIHTDYVRKLHESPQLTFVAISTTVRNYIVSLGFSQEKILLIPNSVPERESISQTAGAVLFSGRLEEEKGLKVLIETWRTYSDLPHLHIAGAGSLNDYVLKAAGDPINITFHGQLNSGDLERVAKECRMIIAPGLWEEPFGRILAEGLARGQAVLSTKNSITEEITEDKHCGAIIEPNYKSIHHNVHAILNLPIEIQIRSCREYWLQNFSVQAVAKSWDLLFRGNLNTKNF